VISGIATALFAIATLGAPSGMVRVGPGVAKPLYQARNEAPRSVAAFGLDRHAVTNGEFLSFVKRNPSWRRDRISPLFGDTGYLASWRSADALGNRAKPDAPVVHVSWFAARAYCESRGARLPTEDEWELAAAADETRFDARDDLAFTERILAWYGEPTPEVLPAVAQNKPNRWGAYDLHGLIWEWVDDFASTPAAGTSADCGGGAETTGAKLDYAAFMRSAFRSSLEARFTTANLGFRCAKNVETP